MRRGEWTEAARLMEEALPNVERSLDETDPELGEVLVTYAEVLRRIGDHTRARALAIRGLGVFEKTLPPEDPRIIEAREVARAAGP
jgi:hypothetical protein